MAATMTAAMAPERPRTAPGATDAPGPVPEVAQDETTAPEAAESVVALCRCGCGRKVHACGYASGCYRRWVRQGRPASGPRPPMSTAERVALSSAWRVREPEPEPLLLDAYDITWGAHQRAQQAGPSPEERARRARGTAADLIRCVAASDAEGIRLLLHKVTDWPALAVVLAECASPDRAAVVTGNQHRQEGRADAA